MNLILVKIPMNSNQIGWVVLLNLLFKHWTCEFKWCINVNFPRENRILLKSVIFAIRIRDPATTTVCWWGEHFMENFTHSTFLSKFYLCLGINFSESPFSWDLIYLCRSHGMDKKAVSQSKTKPVTFIYLLRVDVESPKVFVMYLPNQNLFHIWHFTNNSSQNSIVVC